MNLDLYNFHLRSPAPLPNLQSSKSLSTTAPASRGYSSFPLTAFPGTTGNAAGLSGNATTAMSAVLAMGTTLKSAAPSAPPGLLTPAPPPQSGRMVLRGWNFPLLLVYIALIALFLFLLMSRWTSVLGGFVLFKFSWYTQHFCSSLFVFSISYSAASLPFAVLPV